MFPTLVKMSFQKNKYRSAADANTFAARYRRHMAKHPFLLFGLPFMAVIIGGSFVLTPATAIRYERHDRKVKMVSREDELGIGKAGRRVNMREEYNVSGLFGRDICYKQETLLTLTWKLTNCRDWHTETWTTGNRSGLSVSRARTTACYKGRLDDNNDEWGAI